MQTILLLKAKIAHSAGFYFYNHRWHKVDAGKPVPAAAPFAAHPHAAGQHIPVAHFSDAEWDKLKLPDSNVNAPTFNKQLETLKNLSDTGNVTAILGMKFGTNTYSKKLAQIANHLLGLHGSQHQVAPGQNAGDHPAVTQAPADASQTPKDEALQAAADHLKVDAKQNDIPAPEKAEDNKLVEKIEAAQEAAPDDQKLTIPEFQEGKEKAGVKAYYEGVVKKILAMAAAGDLAGLEGMPTDKGHTWKGKTANSKLLTAFHSKVIDELKGNQAPVKNETPEPAPSAAEPPAADQAPVNQPAPQKLGDLIKLEIAKKAAADKVAQIPWESLKLPDSNSNAGTFNKKLAAIKAAAEAGDVAKLESMKHGVNTYGKMAAKITATAIEALKEGGAPTAKPEPVSSAPEPNKSNWSQHPQYGWLTYSDSMTNYIVEKDDTGGGYSYADSTGKGESFAELSELKNYLIGHFGAKAPTDEDLAKLEASAPTAGPQEGDTKQGADGTLTFHNGRWHKQKQAAGNVTPSWLDGIAIPDLMAGATISQANGLNAMAKDLMEAAKLHGPEGIKGKITQHKTGKKAGTVTVQAAGYKISAMGGNSKVEGINNFHKFVTDLIAASGKIKKTSKPKSSPAPAAPVVAPGGIQSMDSWVQTGPQGGSNPGGRFKDENGVEWYCKFPSSEDVAKSEVLAAKLYAATGVTGQDAKLIMKGGKLGIASRWTDVSKASSPSHLAKTEGVYSGFAVDAWLGNWDVVGLGYDNLQIGADGKAVRVDAGGSLEYRAQGGKKAFGANVTELDSLIDPSINPQAAAVFKGITKADIAASASKVAKLSDESIRILVNTYGPGDAAAKKALADTLIARKADIIAKHPTAKKQKVVKFKPEKISEPPNFLNWGGSGKAGPSSKQFLNEANDKAVQAIYAAAKTGSIDAIKNLTAETYNKESGAVTGAAPVLQHPSQHVKGYAQQAINEINYQFNPPKRFRFDGGHPLHSLNSAYPSHKGALHGSAVNKVGKFVLLGEPGTISLDALALPKITYKSGQLTKATYSPAAKAAIGKMPLTQQQAVQAYTGNGYKEINSSLWSGNPSAKAKSAAEALHTLGHDIAPGTVLSRKMSMSDTDAAAVMNSVGKILQEPAVMSTSIRPDSWSGNVHLKLHVGPGVKGLWVGPGSMPGGGALSVHASEDEIVLPPNTRLLILSTKKSNYTQDSDGFGQGAEYLVEAVVLPSEH